ncbi:MAG: sugar ABC transporter permease, partial [Candidatus Rokubacteria bacterium]|nr:sugar ABC transporter permease [Candidatus Rokubacteria bacterium]
YLFPWVISGIVVGYSWRFVFDPTVGLLNTLLGAAGLSPRPWLVSAPLAMAALLVAATWRSAGYSLVLQMGGLQSIPEEVYEAARIDGATGRRLLRHVVLPLIKPFILINLITTTVDALNTFDLVLALTRGGPLYRTEIVSLYMYHQGFQWGFLGDAAAVSVVVYAVGILFTLGYVRLLHDRDAL